MKTQVSPFGGFLFLLMLMAASCNQPDYKAYYDGIVVELSSDGYSGRSLYGNGDIKAARYIIDCLSSIDGIVPVGTDVQQRECFPAFPEYKSEVYPAGFGRWENEPEAGKYLPYLQSFQFPMNVMRGDMSVSVDGKPLRATFDFTVKEFSPSCNGEYKLVYIPDDKITDDDFVKTINNGEYSDSFVVVSWSQYLTLSAHPFERYIPFLGKLDKVAGVVLKGDDLFPYFKARSYYNLNMPVIMVNEDFPSDAKSIEVHIDSEMIPARDAHNIVAWLPGTDPDSEEHVTFIAHYDHLGMMGRDNIYPGANDNASGVAMILALAQYYSINRPEYGIEFIFLDAEEANLLGAFYYCENPALPLDGIKLLINMDMVADNGDHLATEASGGAMEMLRQIRALNEDGTFPPFDVALQDFSDNSDHYAFGMKGVPSIYFSTEGDYYAHYHTPRDNADNISNENFDRLFSIVTRLVK